MNVIEVIAADGRAHQTVGARGERCVELGLVGGQLVHGLDLVEVEGKLARDAAVETRLQVRRKVLHENGLAANVLLADARHPGIHCLAAVDVLDGRFAEEEVDVRPHVETAHEIRF